MNTSQPIHDQRGTLILLKLGKARQSKLTSGRFNAFVRPNIVASPRRNAGGCGLDHSGLDGEFVTKKEGANVLPIMKTKVPLQNEGL